MNELSEFIESYLSVVMVSIASSRAQPRVASQPHLLAEMKNYSQKRLHPHYSGLDPTQKQMDFEIHFTRENKKKGRHFNQSGEAMSRMTASGMFF